MDPHGRRPLDALDHGAARMHARLVHGAVGVVRVEQHGVPGLGSRSYVALGTLRDGPHLGGYGGVDPHAALGERGLAALLHVCQGAGGWSEPWGGEGGWVGESWKASESWSLGG